MEADGVPDSSFCLSRVLCLISILHEMYKQGNLASRRKPLLIDGMVSHDED
jgi:hypothetical protein